MKFYCYIAGETVWVQKNFFRFLFTGNAFGVNVWELKYGTWKSKVKNWEFKEIAGGLI